MSTVNSPPRGTSDASSIIVPPSDSPSTQSPLDLRDGRKLVVGDDSLYVVDALSGPAQTLPGTEADGVEWEERSSLLCLPPLYRQLSGGRGSSSKQLFLYHILWCEVVVDEPGGETSRGSSRSSKRQGVGPRIVLDYAHPKRKDVVEVVQHTFPLASSHDHPNPAAPSAPASLQPKGASLSVARAWCGELLRRAYGSAQREKRIKVYVNPHAGPGGAVKIWHETVAPLFRAARMKFVDVTITTRPGHAFEQLCHDPPLVGTTADGDTTTHGTTDTSDASNGESSRTDGIPLAGVVDTIVVCSGDGLVYEVFNGIGQRSDAREVLSSVAISHIPCGSGNALSRNLYGTVSPSLVALNIIKGVSMPLDLVSITQEDRQRTMSSTSSGADNSTGGRQVRRTLSFLSQTVGIVAECDLGTEHLRWMGGQRFAYGLLQRIFRSTRYPCRVSVKTAVEGREVMRKLYHEQRAKAKDVRETVSYEGQGLPPLQHGTVLDELRDADGWQTSRHGQMAGFYCGAMPYMAEDANFFPAALANDGLLDCWVVEGDISVSQWLSLLLNLEKHSCFEDPLVQYRKVVAVRVIPDEIPDPEQGYISVDGERVPFAPFQVEVHPGLARVIAKQHGLFQAPPLAPSPP